MDTRKILLASALLFSSIVSAETIVPSNYIIAGEIGDTWVYERLDSIQFTWTLSQVASGPNAGRFERGNIDSGLVYDVAGNVLSLYEIEKFPLVPPWDIGEIELGQVVEKGDPADPSIYLFWKVPSITVQAGTFNDVLAWVWLDGGFSANSANTRLGLDPSITAAVTDVNYFAPGFGEIKYEGVDAFSGNSDGLGSELVSTTVKTPICDIQLNQATYTDGDTVTADIFRVANLTSAPIAVELKVWHGLPEMPPISFFNVGSDGSTVLPAGADIDRGPFPLLSVTADLPRGTHEISCRLLDPVTGGLLSEDLNNFDIREVNLVTNPGFESGATGWIFSDGNPENSRDVGTCPSPCTFPHTGSWAGFKNLFDGGSGTISQSIATSIGTDYMVELWLADNNFETGTVTASFGGTLGVSVTGADTSTTYLMYSFTHTATSTLTDFVFGGVVTGGTFFIDDVSIVAVQ